MEEPKVSSEGPAAASGSPRTRPRQKSILSASEAPIPLVDTAQSQTTVKRNVSFTSTASNSTAYQEHNPPTVLRAAASRTSPEPVVGAPANPVSSMLASRNGSIVSMDELSRKITKSKIEKRDELHILLAVTGSVATIKMPLIVRKLKQIYKSRAVIKLMVTKASTTFLDTSELPKDVKILYDEDEWRSRQGNAEGSLHVELRRWADIMLVAPCSANTLAKFAYGICDNLITSVFRVWNPAVPVLLAPAMNTQMYLNPVTKRHYEILKEFFPYVQVLKPVEKVLVCGDIGMGGMREWADIVQILATKLGLPDDESDEDCDDKEQDSGRASDDDYDDARSS